jgi:hypothetical protein
VRPGRTWTIQAGLFDGWGVDKKAWEQQKDEAYKVQQEILQRRRTGKWQQEVAERRAEVKRYASDPVYKKQVDDERRKNKPKIEEPPLFSIIVPLFPLGIPEYDQGERFDLRGEYAVEGYVDEDADVFKQLKRFFGGGKKQKPDADAKGPTKRK